MPVKAINSKAEFDEIIKGDKPVIIDFWATWCGPCRMISPVLEAISERHDGKIGFYKVDVDEQPDISQEAGITAMPTFIVFHKGESKGSMRGANPAGLEELVQKAIDA